MPEIMRGPRLLQDQKSNNHIIMALHSIPYRGTGGVGSSFLANFFAKKLLSSETKSIKSGDVFRSLFKKTLAKPDQYSDISFDQYRRSLGTIDPNLLRQIDITTDRLLVEQVNQHAANEPITIVDSKLFSWLQFLQSNQILENFPAVTTATLVSIGVFANEATCISRIINRESENNVHLTQEQAKKHRIARLETDLHNINTVLYPEGKNANAAYGPDILHSISHLLINNSAHADKRMMEQFFTDSINLLSEIFPQFASTYLSSFKS